MLAGGRRDLTGRLKRLYIYICVCVCVCVCVSRRTLFPKYNFVIKENFISNI